MRRDMVECCSYALISIQGNSIAQCAKIKPIRLWPWESSESDIFSRVQHPGQSENKLVAFKHGWKSSKPSVAIVKNHEFKIAHVVLSQGACSASQGTGGLRMRETARQSLWAQCGQSHHRGVPQATLLGSHLPHVPGFPIHPRDPVACLCPERIFFIDATNPFFPCYKPKCVS